MNIIINEHNINVNISGKLRRKEVRYLREVNKKPY